MQKNTSTATPITDTNSFFSIMMDQLEMLTAREQLMEDIDSIVESHLCGSNVRSLEVEELTRILCDAVCKNFPTN